MDEELELLGWFVELDGRRVALLTDLQFYDMFWVSLTVTPMVEDLGERLRIGTDRLWWLENKLSLRNRITDAVTATLHKSPRMTTPSHPAPRPTPHTLADKRQPTS
jgi:hypothetical protein